MGRVDELRGFKENVILGHLIPGGTGFPLYRYAKFEVNGVPISQEEMDEVYGKMDENGTRTDLIDVPESELVDDEEALQKMNAVSSETAEDAPDMVDMMDGELY